MSTDLRFATAIACLSVVRNSAVLDLQKDDYDFLIRNELWIHSDRTRARRCVEAAIYGALDYVGYPRISVPAEFVAGAIVFFVSPVNYLTACHYFEGCEFSDNVINDIEAPLSSAQLFALVCQISSCNLSAIHNSQDALDLRLKAQGISKESL